MIRLSVAIQHHPERAARLQEMLEQLGPRRDEVKICADPGTNGSWHTARMAWSPEVIGEDSSHHLVLQDDLVFCKEFLIGLERAIRHRPAAIIASYAGQKTERIAEAHDAGKAWAQIPNYLSGQALVMPSVWARDFLRWHDAWLPAWDDTEFWKKQMKGKPLTDAKLESYKTCASDWRVKMFAKHNSLPIWFTVPSLVNHAAPMDSLIQANSKIKVAKRFLGEDRSALEIDWRKR